MKLNKYIDHTLLKPEATTKEITILCEEALKFDFASVCINPTYVKLASTLLKNSDVKVCTVIGFPLGANTTPTKVFEITNALENGADEIDMVMNISAFKSQDFDLVQADIAACKAVLKNNVLKVIIETCLLTKEEIVLASQIVLQAGADFVKTSTGFNKGGATVEDVKLMATTVGDQIKVKAAGGVRTKNDALEMIAAGASRIGTSGGVAIVQNQQHNDGY
ncbi:deoxyribose-phosphate aldolase [Spiroplasma syrphidicola EA-1]|uniref:Deoxyribose-phosphate aldolase n=1 Tax=Spiroplasma syrphidicola EA-1 TaxID=1276229 RepID=R4U4E2_9MOLU|nr:deoxyribose-phosphate aldolase [Spiroplasma syrphidicola]AGM26347.1 deoxyribose-phosphate aldolase [Spiroplasma syrphidicola EA-1]